MADDTTHRPAHRRGEGETFQPGFNVTETEAALYIYWAEEAEFTDPFTRVNGDRTGFLPRYKMRIPKDRLESHGMQPVNQEGVKWLLPSRSEIVKELENAGYAVAGLGVFPPKGSDGE